MSIRPPRPTIETNIFALLLQDPNITGTLTSHLASTYVQTANFENGYLAVAQVFLGMAAIRFNQLYHFTQKSDLLVFYERAIAHLNGVLSAGTKALGGKTLIGVLEATGAKRALETALLLRRLREEGEE